MTNDATKPVEVTQADRDFLAGLLATMGCDGITVQEAREGLSDHVPEMAYVARHRIASRVTDKTLAADAAVVIRSLLRNIGISDHITPPENGKRLSAKAVLTSLEGQG